MDSASLDQRTLRREEETRRILQVNNRGVSEFHNGNVEESIKTFRDALSAYQRVSESLEGPIRERGSNAHSEDGLNDGRPSVSPSPSVLPVEPTPNKVELDSTKNSAKTATRPNPSDSRLVGKSCDREAGSNPYLHPVWLDANSCFSASDGQNGGGRVMISCILIFNLAVATHAFAVSCIDPDTTIGSRCYWEALSGSYQLYNFTFQLLVEMEDEEVGCPPCTLILRRLVLLTVLYCMGEVHCLSGRPEIARNCYSHLYLSLLQLHQEDEIQENDFPAFFCLDEMYYTVFRELGVLSQAVTAPGA